MNAARLRELLADRALGALEEGDDSALRHELELHPEREDPGLEQAAAAIALAGLRPTPLPAHLRTKLSDLGARWAEERRAERAPPAPAASFQPSTHSAPATTGGTRAAERRTPRLPWVLAAAASLVALLGWLREVRDPGGVARSPAEARASLLAEASALLRLEWSAGPDATGAGAGGDVVWSDARQEGYLRLVGLARNDPTREQYQLWIFDKAQKIETPVDGGVFDVDGPELVVPIDAKLAVGEAFAFAVTVERPGGVVVSDRSRIALLAGL